MEVLSFQNTKGGVGKTTLCYAVGTYLATTGKKVLFIDLDPQETLTRYLEESELDYTENVYEVLSEKIPISAAIQNAENFDYVPGNLRTQKLFAGVSQHQIQSEIETIKDKYDYILLDCSPSLNSITYSAFQASDTLMMPYKSSKGDMDSTLFTVEEATKINKSLRIIAILNCYRKTQREEIFLDAIPDGIEKTTFPNLTILPGFVDTGDSFELKRNLPIKEATAKLVDDVLGVFY